MRVWLLAVGEPLPTDDGVDRAWRAGLLTEQLVRRGHEVVWWSSAFDHFRRRQRSPTNTPIGVSPSLTVWHLEGLTYRRNLSLARLRNHRQVADSFRRLAPSQPRPDVVVSSLPTLELCCAAVDYGAAHQVPVVIDVQDLWPDVAIDLAPSILRGAARRMLWWMTREVQYATRRASAIVGLTDEFVQWGLAAAQRTATNGDRAFPMGYSSRVPATVELLRAETTWDDRGLRGHAGQFIVCFFGTLGRMFDFDTVVTAATRLRRTAPEVTLVICGAGERLAALRQRARALDNMVLPGHVGAAEVYALMRRSSAGLAPYRPLRNFHDNLPNKPIEYLSAGLPIIASRLDVLGRLIKDHGCGISYDHGDDRGLENAVLELVRNPAGRIGMAGRAATLFRQKFLAERVYDDMAAHLEGLARSHTGAVGATGP
jgi:glycosyltransferase involved in cell wall biosynthesis